MAYFRRRSRGTFSGRSKWLRSNTLKPSFTWTKANSVFVNDSRSKLGNTRVLSNSHLSLRRVANSSHLVWSASESQSSHTAPSSHVQEDKVENSHVQTEKAGMHTLEVKKKQKPAICNTRRCSVEFMSKYALKRTSGTVNRTMSVPGKKPVAQIDKKRSEISLTSPFKLVKNPVESDLGEKTQSSSKVVTTARFKETTKPPNLFKKVGSYQLVRVTTSVSPEQRSGSQSVSKKCLFNAQSSALHNSKLSLKVEHKSQFKLVRLRKRSLSKTVPVSTNENKLGSTSSTTSQYTQRRSSCRKRVTRYKVVRGRRESLTKKPCRPEKFKSHSMLLRTEQPLSKERRVSANWLQTKTGKLGSRSISRQLIRRADGTFMLRSRYCLVKNGNSVGRRAYRSVYKTIQQLSHEEKLAQRRVTIQATAHKLVRRSLSLVRARTAQMMSKSNSKKFCMFFNRFGRCKRGNSCPCIHDPDKVAVCTKFVRGMCDKMDGSCRFSHTIIKDKMPTCSFFLRGVCHNDNCPYSHVRVAQSASICEDFCRGYCPRGQKCKNKHILVCPRSAYTGRKRIRSTDSLSRTVNHSPAKRQLVGVRTPTAFKQRGRKGRTETRQRQASPLSNETACVSVSEEDVVHVDTASSSLPIEPDFLED
ncbi:zinc finger CCCH domain-containing protein 3-like isoform X2 [Corticium candelabrum]|uniref:zinc finger CCCH domain-containing protein 3-like isoform X2 n=1 Tax=Corticium candelabrum TaxID=121492 RepID=UPI002E25A163|nr:zinc finger CCCH domain-containing protein 3-like isoform X2 [Corticium candelabrum]